MNHRVSPKASGFTKQMARNMFYGGSALFCPHFYQADRFYGCIFHIFDSERKIPFRSNAEAITPAVINGKNLWETRNCIGCHTLLGEGAYFAPELGNVYQRRGRRFHQGLDARRSPPHPGRRQMPQFNFTEAATRRSGRVPALDRRHQHRKVAAQY
jgi:nitric oxide reductase subunit C